MSNIDLTQVACSMSTREQSFQVTSGSDGSIKIETNTPQASEWLKTIFNRALNTWDEAPAEVKELGDLVIDGKSLQSY